MYIDGEWAEAQLAEIERTWEWPVVQGMTDHDVLGVLQMRADDEFSVSDFMLLTLKGNK